MIKLVLLFLSGLLLISCGRKAFLATEIDHVDLKIENETHLNHGSTFQVDVYAYRETGKGILLNELDSMKLSAPELYQSDKRTFIIDQTPTSFRDTFYVINFTYSDTSGVYAQTDSIHLGYRAPIQVMPTIQSPVHGADRRKRSSTLFGRDGVDGEKGGSGKNGDNGYHYTIYAWKQDNQLRLRVEVDSLNVVWKYKSYRTDSLTIVANGARGGNGGKGGDGGDGKNESGGKIAGNGGKGGDGGDAGNGGDGGSVLIFVHENVAELAQHIRVLNQGGINGTPGSGGDGGKGGDAGLPDRHGQDGIPGTPGKIGLPGKDGPPPVISVTAFDFTRLD